MRISVVVAVVGVVALTGPPSAQAQFADPDQLARVESIIVAEAMDYSSDYESHRCLPRRGTLQTEAELVLRRAGVPVGPSLWAHRFVVSVAAVRTRAVCAVATDFTLQRFQNVVDRAAPMSGRAPATSLGLVVAFFQTGVRTARPADMREDLREEVNTVAASLANEILKARQRR